MQPASPKMSSLSVLPLFLLLLALHTHQAQGQPLRTYYNLIKEIEAILNEPPVPSQVSSRDKVGMGQGRAGSAQANGTHGLTFSLPHRTP